MERFSFHVHHSIGNVRKATKKDLAYHDDVCRVDGRVDTIVSDVERVQTQVAADVRRVQAQAKLVEQKVEEVKSQTARVDRENGAVKAHVESQYKQVNGRVDRVEDDAGKLKARVSRVDREIGAVKTKVDGKYREVNGRVTRVEGQIEAFKENTKQRQDDVDAQFEQVNEQVNHLEERMDNLLIHAINRMTEIGTAPRVQIINITVSGDARRDQAALQPLAALLNETSLIRPGPREN